MLRSAYALAGLTVREHGIEDKIIREVDLEWICIVKERAAPIPPQIK